MLRWDALRQICHQYCPLTGTYKFRGKDKPLICHDRCEAHPNFLRDLHQHLREYFDPDRVVSSDTAVDAARINLRSKRRSKIPQ